MKKKKEKKSLFVCAAASCPTQQNLFSQSQEV